GDWVHWVLFNIPPDINSLSEGIAGEKIQKIGAKQGLNDFGSIGYGGPCPPPGQTHRYNFKIFALDVTLDLEPAIEKQILLKAVKNHILAKGQLTGAFKR
ncbi:MAG: YbhB/YbcL family Raf kinase inhibitor-like protein, partial [Bacteroidales bacterium]|nr:YbhB/YbcL family Raf kinase inhibitor-like protein [Bacteroidales bacterium]